MRLKTLMSVVFLILSFQFVVNAQKSEEIFTIYLVRHAEKELSAVNPKDPPLTPCGMQRAESLATSHPEIPMQKPTLAFSRALASAMPSAVTATVDPTDLRPMIKANLSSGVDRANTFRELATSLNFDLFPTS